MPCPRKPGDTFPQRVGLDRKKSCQHSSGSASGSSTILRQKAVTPRPKSSRPMSVWMMDWKCANYRPSFLGLDRALRTLMPSGRILGAYSSSGRHGGEFPSSTSVALASTAAAAVDTAAWSSEGNLAT